MALDLAKLPDLAAELGSDPAKIGYAAALALGDDAAAAAILNAPADGVTVPAQLSKQQFVACLDANELAKPFPPGLDLVLAHGDLNDLVTRATLISMMTGMPKSAAAVGRIASRPGSRAEVLFGPGTVIRHEDIAAVFFAERQAAVDARLATIKAEAAAAVASVNAEVK